jgi:predicted nucleic-acid-binding Zn-ribbon protein
LDERELNNFLQTAGVKAECPSCGHTHSAAILEGGFDLALPIDVEGRTDAPAPSGGFVVVPLVCRNCGFVRLYAKDAVTHRWQGGT